MRKRMLMTDDQRKELLEQILTELALLQLTDSDPTWAKAIAKVPAPDGKPLTYQTVWNWMQEPWGKELAERHRKGTTHAGNDILYRKFVRAMGHQVAIACGDIGEPKDAVAAWKGLKPFYEAAGILGEHTENVKPASVQVLIQQFSGAVRVSEQQTVEASSVKVLEG
jgi:hypothetical protein